MVLTHVPMGVTPPGRVNLHGHVHNSDPLRDTPHINACVEHRDYRPLPLESLVTLAKRLLAGAVPRGATTGDRIRSTETPTGERAAHPAAFRPNALRWRGTQSRGRDTPMAERFFNTTGPVFPTAVR